MEPSPFVFGNKPYGVTTHRSDPSLPGYQEWLAHDLQKQLYVCHRLDKETTGAMIFATTAEAAARLTEEFTHGRVDKEYVFITDRAPNEKTWTVNSPITNVKTEKTSEAETAFEVRDEQHGFYIVTARPKAGRTHQIRIHAAESGIPLLGDAKYGGTPFSHFFLHCFKISVPALNISHREFPPVIYSHRDFLKKPLLTHWLMSHDRRLRLYADIGKSDYRWIHDEGTPLRLDVLGYVGGAGWWREEPPSMDEMAQLEEFFEFVKIKEWRLMHYSGQRLQDKPVKDLIARSAWNGTEKNLRVEYRKESGLSCGLFLDQRENRQWVRANSADKNVLNLFAYTGAFSVAAALGGAAKVTTVDLSKNYIDWCKTNFKANGLDVEAHGFYDMDSMAYLKYAEKKQMAFDLVVCDPPSFSRDKKGNVFRIEKNFADLLTACGRVLSPGGAVLFSNNYEKWDADRWLSELTRALRGEHLEITRKSTFGWDFEITADRHMKAFLLAKK